MKYIFCKSTWSLGISMCDKTRVVHFRQRVENRTMQQFKGGKKGIDVCEKYKFLCLWFTCCYKLHGKSIAVAVHWSLGFLFAKSKCIGITYEYYTKLYDSLVQSIVDYGVCMLFHNSFPFIKIKLTIYMVVMPTKLVTCNTYYIHR